LIAGTAEHFEYLKEVGVLLVSKDSARTTTAQTFPIDGRSRTAE